MIARQYTLPPLPDDRDDPLVQAEVQTIRTKLGTKECFPDLNTFMSSLERKMETLKGAEAKQRHLQQAIQDLTYILDASESVYGFLGRVGGIEDPAPFVTYLDAGRSTLFYLQRWLTEVTEKSIRAGGDPAVADRGDREEYQGKGEGAINLSKSWIAPRPAGQANHEYHRSSRFSWQVSPYR